MHKNATEFIYFYKINKFIIFSKFLNKMVADKADTRALVANNLPDGVVPS